jgi:hypothetical protein
VTITITINTDNAAFEDAPINSRNADSEIGRILRRMADEFEQTAGASDPRDINGNTDGTVTEGGAS